MEFEYLRETLIANIYNHYLLSSYNMQGTVLNALQVLLQLNLQSNPEATFFSILQMRRLRIVVQSY